MVKKSKSHFDTRDHSCRFAIDTALRNIGFEIYSRPNKGEPIWKKKDIICSQSEAMLHLPEQQYEDAKYAEELYEGYWNE